MNGSIGAFLEGTLLRIPFVLLAAGLLSACDLINPAEEIPAYIYITEFQLNTNRPSQGSDSEKITEAWLSVSGEFLGAYTPPAKIPILASGEQLISLEVGIKENGITATPDIYPFYKTFEITLDLQATEIDSIQPIVTYREETQFSIIEEFEREDHLFQEIRFGDVENRIKLTQDDVFEGAFSGRIVLTKENPSVEIATIGRFAELTKNGVFVYLEVNYKSDVPVVFGMIGHQAGVISSGEAFFDPGFAAKEEWNKIYFNLTPLFFQGSFDEYQIALQTFIPLDGGEFTLDRAEIYLDNIKLVHF